MRPVHARQSLPLTSHHCLTEILKGFMPLFSCCHLSAVRRKSLWLTKKKNPKSQTTTNQLRLLQRMQMECALLLVPMPDETLLCSSASERRTDGSHPDVCTKAFFNLTWTRCRSVCCVCTLMRTEYLSKGQLMFHKLFLIISFRIRLY